MLDASGAALAFKLGLVLGHGLYQHLPDEVRHRPAFALGKLERAAVQLGRQAHAEHDVPAGPGFGIGGGHAFNIRLRWSYGPADFITRLDEFPSLFFIRMSDFSARLREERVRLGLSQQQMATIGGVKLNAQSNYETGKRSPDAEYLEALAAHDVDVAYVLTGHRMLMAGYVAPPKVQVQKQARGTEARKPTVVQQVAEDVSAYGAKPSKVLREVTQEEAALLDNYEAADEKGRAAARSVLDALAEPKKRAHG